MSICQDPRLGPVHLPTVLPLLSFIADYDRFGGEQPGDWLKHWTDEKGQFVYPPENGFQLDLAGKPILGNMTIQPGTKLDRFGSESGKSYFVRTYRRQSVSRERWPKTIISVFFLRFDLYSI